MKKIFLLTFFVFAILTTQAQQFPKLGENIANPSLGKFEGKWIWTAGADTIRLILKKENTKNPGGVNITADIITGYYTYKKGNVIIDDNYELSKKKYDDKTSLMMLGIRQQTDSISGFIYDAKKDKTLPLTLTISPDRKSLHFRLRKSGEQIKINKKVHEGYTLPFNLKFRKEN